jgi:hypothetical protein
MFPNCDQEIYNIQVSTVNVEQYSPAHSNVNFVATLGNTLKDVVRAELVTASIPCNTSNVVYIAVDELANRFTDYADTKPATGQGHSIQTSGNRLRDTFGAVYSDDINVKNRITYYNRYPIVAEYPYPIQRLDKLSIRLSADDGTLLTDQGNAFFTFRFICNRKNMC